MLIINFAGVDVKFDFFISSSSNHYYRAKHLPIQILAYAGISSGLFIILRGLFVPLPEMTGSAGTILRVVYPCSETDFYTLDLTITEDHLK